MFTTNIIKCFKNGVQRKIQKIPLIMHSNPCFYPVHLFFVIFALRFPPLYLAEYDQTLKFLNIKNL